MWIVIGVIILVVILAGIFLWTKKCKDKPVFEAQIEELEGFVAYWKEKNQEYEAAIIQTESMLSGMVLKLSTLILGQPEDCLNEIQELSIIINTNGQLQSNLGQLESELSLLTQIQADVVTWYPNQMYAMFRPESQCLLESDLLVGIVNLIEMELKPLIATIPTIQETNSAEFAATNLVQTTISQVNNAVKGPLGQCDPLKLEEYNSIRALANSTGEVAQTAGILPSWQLDSHELLATSLATALVNNLVY